MFLQSSDARVGVFVYTWRQKSANMTEELLRASALVNGSKTRCFKAAFPA